MVGSRRRGEEELLERLQVEGIVRIGKEVGSLEWRGRRGRAVMYAVWR